MGPPLLRIEAAARAALLPPPRTDLATWIEDHLVLPEGLSGSAGRVRLWPYQRGICDAISDPGVERITVVKSARLGYTTLLTGMIASYVANDPCQILVVLPTDDDCRDYVVSEIEPVFAASGLGGRLTADTEGKKRNTITRWRYPGGSAKFISGQSPRNMRRHNARVLIIDEAAALADSIEAGSTISRAVTRTKGFDDRKIIIGSTPLEETSNVLLAYAASYQRRFEVPCPACGGFTYLEWRHIEWEADRPETAAFRCPHCDGRVEERHKPAMVAAGRWIARRPEVLDHAGFLINALVSPLPKASWPQLVAEFLAAKDDPELLRPFVNETLAEPWTGDADDLDEAELMARAEPFGLGRATEDGSPRPIPAEVLLVTIGTDVQDDRLECSVVGFSATDTFVLDHAVIWGSPADDDTWRQHDALLRTRWAHPLGGQIGVAACAVDSGDGDWTDRVYGYCFPRRGWNVMAIKGVGGSRPAIVPSKAEVKGGTLWIVGVDGLKSVVAALLSRGTRLRFADCLGLDYFEQLTAERRIVRRFRGQPRRSWERIPGRRAEALDCLIYATAARRRFPDASLPQRAEALTGQGARNAVPPPRPGTRPPRRIVRSRYMRD